MDNVKREKLFKKISSLNPGESIYIVFSETDPKPIRQTLISVGADNIITVTDSSEKIVDFWERVYNNNYSFALPVIMQLSRIAKRDEFEYSIIDYHNLDADTKHVPLGPSLGEFLSALFEYFKKVSG